jgi:hypothetical protein
MSRMTLLALALLPGTALAQSDTPPDPVIPEAAMTEEGAPAGPPAFDPMRVRFTFTVDAYHAFRSDLKDSDASLAVSRVGGDIGAFVPITQKLSLFFSGGYELSDYDIEDGGDLVPGDPDSDPLKEFHRVRFSGGAAYALDQAWSVRGAAFFDMSWERGGDAGEGIVGGAFGAFDYKFSDDFSLGFGVGAQRELEEDFFVFPIVLIQWQINEQLRLENERLGARLTYTFNQNHSAYLRGGYERVQFRLNNDRAELANGVLRDEEAFVIAGYAWQPSPNVSLSLEAGSVVWRKLTYTADGGDDRARDTLKPAPYIGLRFEYRF